MDESPTVLAEKTDEALAVISLSHKEAFSELIRRYEVKLRRYVRRLGMRGSDDAEDLLQNIFIKAYEHAGGFDPDLQFSSWIYRIAHNETISLFRKHSVRPEGHIIDVSEEVIEQIADDIDIAKDYDAKLREEMLRKSIDRLDEKYRSVIILRYLEEKSYDEISDILRISPGTVATRISRAKEQLGKYIKKEKHMYEY